MKLLHRQILRMLPGPFLGWMGTLMFLLLMQFLIKYLPDIVGKGLPFTVIVELIAYNLAYMVVLAVPMSVLIASLMAFGRLAETNAYLVIKSAGVSFPQIIWPALLVGLFLTLCMGYFNNEVLPEANFRAKNLWQDIRRKKPGFELQPGVFYDGLNGYSILVQHIPPESNELSDILIYDYTEGSRQQTVIKATRGRIESVGDGTLLNLILEEGEVHRPQTVPLVEPRDRYERLAFDRFLLRLDLSDFSFERSDPKEGYRSDRTMRTADMVHIVDSLEAAIAATQGQLARSTLGLYEQSRPPEADLPPPDAPPSLPAAAPEPQPPYPTQRVALTGLDSTAQVQVYDRALQYARMARTGAEDAQRTLLWEMQHADRYRVEIHKKYAIAVACLIFMLIGAPLGLSLRRGGLGTAGALAIGIFLFYWVSLVQGEKLADRGLLTPWVGMWIANIVVVLAGLWLTLYVTFDQRLLPRRAPRRP